MPSLRNFGLNEGQTAGLDGKKIPGGPGQRTPGINPLDARTQRMRLPFRNAPLWREVPQRLPEL